MNQHMPDPVLAAWDLRKQNRLDFVQLLAYAVVFTVSLFMSAWQFRFYLTDMNVHATIAGDFDFTNLRSITSRLAYPMWHLIVAVIYQLGVPLMWASAIVCALAKTAGMVLARILLSVFAGTRIHRHLLTLASFVLMFITAIHIPAISVFVYKGIGSPTVWHNPTQMMVVVSMFLCVPYTVHLWYEFERRLPSEGNKTALPWHMVGIQAALLMFSLACKPTVLQALLPAAALFFLVQWVWHPKNIRYFLQVILAFLPAAAYFLLQYLYYTGVVVEFSSGVSIGLTPEAAWLPIRNFLLMAAFPLFAILCCRPKDLFKDKMLVLTLIMVVVGILEAMFFRETGQREGHGNFNWANMSNALMLWVIMLGKFMASFSAFYAAKRRPWYRYSFYSAGFLLLLWHFASGVYYLYHLLASQNTF